MAAPDAGDPHTAVAHELLVRYLDAWTPAVLHGSRRACYAEGYAGAVPQAELSAVAALRVFGEFGDLLARRPLAMALVAPSAEALAGVAAALAEVRTELRIPDGLEVHTAVGKVCDALVPLLAAIEALNAPILAYLDAHGAEPPTPDEVTTVVGHKGAELLLRWDSPGRGSAARPYPMEMRKALQLAGLTAVCLVELVDGREAAQALLFATRSAKNLEKFKDELWALDEYAGIRYRDPGDGEGSLLDISLQPHLGPLRRAMLGVLGDGAARTLADLRSFAVSETIYRAADATRAVSALLASGAVAREPAEGRLVPSTSLRAV
jgi:hypothetical protein